MAIKIEPSLQARTFLEDNYPRVNLPGTMSRLLERVFSKAEAECLKQDEQFKTLTVIGTWRKLRNCSISRAVVDIVYVLDGIGAQTRNWLLNEIGETDTIVEELIEQAAATGALVLVNRPRALHWQGAEIDVIWDNYSALWEYLDVLVRAAKAGDEVDYMSLGRDARPSLPKYRKYALRQLDGFPSALADCIDSTKSHAQQLNLPPDQIRIFEEIGRGDYREWLP